MRLILALRPTLITAPQLRSEQWQELLSRSLPIGALAESTLLLHAVPRVAVREKAIFAQHLE